MSLPFSIGDILKVIELTIATFEKIHDAPERIEKVGKGMKSLKQYLAELEELLARNAKHGLAAQRPTLAARIEEIVHDIEKDAKEVQVLLNRWHNKIGPGGFELRFTLVANALFAIGSSPGKLDALTTSIEEHKTDLDRQLFLLKEFADDMTKLEQKKRADKLEAILSANITNGNKPMTPPPRPMQQLQPSRPSLIRSDFQVIFIDGGNEGRSIIAEAYCKLLRGWTQKWNGTWRIKYVYSAGYRVKWRSDCIDTTKRIVKNMEDGNKLPDKIALEAFFRTMIMIDQFRVLIKQETESKRSRGVWKDLFANFDYIFVFDKASLDTLNMLKEAFKVVYGASAVPEGKGKLVHLGCYTSDGRAKDLMDLDPPSLFVPLNDRWNKIHSMIKDSFKNWLSREMGWRNPGAFASALSVL